MPLSSSVKSVNLSSRDSGSLPKSVIALSCNPAFLNCFLALVILAKSVPAFLATVAFASSDNAPET